MAQASFSRWLAGRMPGDGNLVLVMEYLDVTPRQFDKAVAAQRNRVATRKRREAKARPQRRASIRELDAALTLVEQAVAVQRGLLVEVLGLLNPERAEELQREWADRQATE